MTRIETFHKFQRAVEILEDRRDTIVWQLKARADAHAKALDPTGTLYLKYRVPKMITRVTVSDDGKSVAISGTDYEGDSEKWEMPLDYANADTPCEAWLAEISELAKNQQTLKELAEKRRTEANERAQFELLKAKFEPLKAKFEGK